MINLFSKKERKQDDNETVVENEKKNKKNSNISWKTIFNLIIMIMLLVFLFVFVGYVIKNPKIYKIENYMGERDESVGKTQDSYSTSHSIHQVPIESLTRSKK